MSADQKRHRFAALVQDVLLGRRRTRWRSTHGRWLRAGLTVALVVAGLTTWALAIVQPWKAQAADPGIVPIKDLLSPNRVRELAVATDQRVGPPAFGLARPVTRNPFCAKGTDGAAKPAASPVPEEPGTGDRSCTPWTAGRVAEVAQGLSLKATVASPSGERWAVINGETYREGDEVAGLRLVEVREDRARLDRAGIQCVLKMD